MISIQIEEMTENTAFEDIMKTSLELALIFLDNNKDHGLFKKYNIQLDGYEILVC